MTREDVLENLRSAIPVIAPSMLKCDFANLEREVASLEAAGAKTLHWDVMDGHFVPNLSYGAMVISALRRLTPLVFDAHLMVSDPARYLDDFVQAGCNAITFHVEAVPQPAPLLRRIRQAGALAGLALNPGTPIDRIQPALPDCDLVLVMSVEPGFGGQKFIPSALDKLRALSDLVAPTTLLSIDGGIGPTTIGASAAAGASMFVAGSAIFQTDNYGPAIEELGRLARNHQVSSTIKK